MNSYREFDYLNYYKNWGGESNSYLEKVTLKLIRINSYPRHQRSRIEILDIGFGVGTLLKILTRRGFKTSGIEISEASIIKLNKELEAQKIDTNIMKGDILALPFSDNYFDIVVALEVLEHTVDLPRAAKELNRVLKPGGILIISTPYRQKIKHEKCIFCHRRTPRDGHLHSFGEEDLYNLFKEKGLKAEKTKICFSKMDRFPFLEKFYLFPFSSLLDWLDLKISNKLGIFPPYIVIKFRKI